MSTRANFLKSELQKIYNFLNVSFEYADHARLENDTRFIKIFELLMEISDKSITLNKVVQLDNIMKMLLDWSWSIIP